MFGSTAPAGLGELAGAGPTAAAGLWEVPGAGGTTGCSAEMSTAGGRLPERSADAVPPASAGQVGLPACALEISPGAMNMILVHHVGMELNPTDFRIG